VAFISSSAQLKAQKHVTSVEMVQAAEGARVTVISDSALNDYEAFRRGDRFYVKIPLAEFAFSQPRFHGNGFDDVQVQKVGDSVVVSFRLQPGAAAHVEQHANRLEVIFTAVNRSQPGSLAKVASNRLPSGEIRGTQGSQDRQRDAAGSVPSNGPPVSRERYVNGRAPVADLPQRQPARNARTENHQSRSGSVINAPLASSTPQNVASPTPVPNYPPASSYSLATSTPISTPINSKPVGVSSNPPNSNKIREWFLANQKAVLLAALILAGLLALGAAFLYRGRMTKASAKRVRRPLAQPKYDSKAELDEVTASPLERGPGVAAPSSEGPSKSEWSRVASKPAIAPAAEVAAGHAAAFSKTSNSSVAVADNKSGSEEREVFEL